MSGMNFEELLYVAGNLFRIYVIYRFFHLFFLKEASKKQIECVAYFIFFAINTGIQLFFQMPFLNLAVNILATFIITYLYKGTLRTRIIAVLIVTVVYLACEEVVYRCMLYLNEQNNIAMGTIIPTLMVLLIIVIFEKVYGYQNGDNLLPKQIITIALVPILSIFILTVALQSDTSDLQDALSGIGLVIINLLIIYLFNNLAKTYESRSELALERQKNEALQRQLQLMLDSEQNLSSLRHDMKNHLLALKSFSDEGDKYIDYLMSSIENPERYVETGNMLIDGILNLKLSEAEKKGAQLYVDVNTPKEISISGADLNIILSNLMDNAILAMQGCPDKYVNLEMRYDPCNLILRISNPYEGEIRFHNGNYLTTKTEKSGHGIGLKTVRKTVEKYNGVLDIGTENHCFTVSILMFEKPAQV